MFELNWKFALIILVVNASLFSLIFWVMNHPDGKVGKFFERRSRRYRKSVRRTTGNTKVNRTTGKRPLPMQRNRKKARPTVDAETSSNDA